MRTGVYPGTFDPPTTGHMDLIVRCAALVDHLVVGIGINASKSPMFTPEERAALVHAELDSLGLSHKVEVRFFDQLLVDFARESGAQVIFRGLRAISDFDFEFQMAGMNRHLRPEIETVFLMCSDKHQFVSSRFVKEIARLGGDISPFVSPRVLAEMMAKLAAQAIPASEARLAGGEGA